MSNKGKFHSAVYELRDDLQKGKLSRREFLRYASLLGVSAAAASQLVGLGWPRKVLASPIQRGGTIKVSILLKKLTHPSQAAWMTVSQIIRSVTEYLTFTDGNNITHPYLLKSWSASDDMKTWTLNLREGIKFNNGDDFVSDDVVFTLNQWLDKDVGSSMLGLVGAYLDPSGIEKTSQYQVKLHLKKAEIAIPEHFATYPGMVLNHRTFEGDFLKQPHGTGPFTLDFYRESDRCLLKRRTDYWQKGEDGKSLPYLDAIEFIDMGEERAPQIVALKKGQIDMMNLAAGASDVYQALKDDPNMQTLTSNTSEGMILRMRVDKEPWTDNRVRMALKLCQNREKILALSYFNEGLLAHDTHVYPKHPEYCEKPIPKYDPQRAKQLLKEAGYPNGLDVPLSIGVGWTDVVRYAEILREDAAPAGFRITLDTMPNSQYWEKWTEVGLGITDWTHYPLGTMVLNMAYVGDDKGKPVSWNESRWVDEEFSELLTRANGILDVDERRKIFCKLEEIQMTRGSIGVPFWKNSWNMARKRVRGLEPHPNNYIILDRAWLEKGA